MQTPLITGGDPVALLRHGVCSLCPQKPIRQATVCRALTCRGSLENIKSLGTLLLQRFISLVKCNTGGALCQVFFLISPQARGIFWTDKKGTAFAVPFDGRGDRIRTCGLFVPNEALYQAEPHLDFNTPFVDSFFIISAEKAFVNGIFEKIENFSKGHIRYADIHRDTVSKTV